MGEIAVTLTANAGILLRTECLSMAVDAFHDHPAPPFSTVTPALLNALEAAGKRSGLDLIAATHIHDDHFGTAPVQRAMVCSPAAAFAAPEPVLPGQLLITGPAAHLRHSGFTLDFRRMPHDGEEYRDVPLYGLVLTCASRRVLIPGDSTDHDAVLALMDGKETDTAILNFPWITHPKNRAFVDEILRPKHLLLCHLPFPADDVDGFIPAAARDAAKLRNIPDVRLLTHPMQEELIL